MQKGRVSGGGGSRGVCGLRWRWRWRGKHGSDAGVHQPNAFPLQSERNRRRLDDADRDREGSVRKFHERASADVHVGHHVRRDGNERRCRDWCRGRHLRDHRLGDHRFCDEDRERHRNRRGAWCNRRCERDDQSNVRAGQRHHHRQRLGDVELRLLDTQRDVRRRGAAPGQYRQLSEYVRLAHIPDSRDVPVSLHTSQ